MTPDIPAYLDYLPAPLLAAHAHATVAIEGVDGMRADADLVETFPELHGTVPMGLVANIYRQVREQLGDVLEARKRDRKALDERTLALREENAGVAYLSPEYRTVIGTESPDGTVLVGTLDGTRAVPPVDLPDHIAGPAVTLFGPPDDPRMCINAMNAVHRKLPNEPDIVRDLVEASGLIPRWGADSEDSKTPFARDLLSATANLADCFAGTLDYTDPRSGKHYSMHPDKRAVPIKRVPGIALPTASHTLDGSPLPLHIVDLVLHAWLNRDRPQAQVFYVPKLENESEAAYFSALVRATEAALHALHPAYPLDTIRLFVVFETPRAIFRIREMATALHPHFAGGSLGWHDFLAATARLFRHDDNYRIPVKADPNIVIHHIKESHVHLAQSLAGTGAVKIGGMYGTLYETGNDASFEVTMAGYIKDVVSQFRRGLTGFWVAHPDFVRPGIALVEAIRRRDADSADSTLIDLVTALLPSASERDPVLRFLAGPDVEGLDAADPLYPRALLAADLETSPVIANHDPEEVRYNVFQALQYLAAWLGGTGCVALPAAMRTTQGDPVFVRVMDDLATTERSRWELWAEVAHGRVSLEDFTEILRSEIAFLRAGVDNDLKRVQIRWEEPFGRWYPTAARLLWQLVTDPEPVEAVTELLLPFTLDEVRDTDDPWATARRLCPGRFLDPADLPELGE